MSGVLTDKAKEVQGKGKEAAGRATDDDQLKADQAKGDLTQADEKSRIPPNSARSPRRRAAPSRQQPNATRASGQASKLVERFHRSLN